MAIERFKILLVEDNPADRLLYRLSLHDQNECRFESHEAAFGQVGLEACRKQCPDCIVLDYHLPDMDGLEFISALKNEFGNLPCAIVMLTGAQDERIAVRAMKLGATDYIPKTEKIGEVLGQSIIGAIERFRMRRKIEEQQAALEVSERKYRSLMESTPQLVWLARDDGALVYANRRWIVYTGFEPTPNVPLSLNQVLFEDDRDRFWDAWCRGIELKTEFEMEIRLRRGADGANRWHLMYVVPSQDFPDTGAAWLGTCADIENNKQAERAIQQMQKWESIGVLAGGIAHDFNNILTSILGNASFLSDILPADHHAQPMLDSIIHSSERAANLTRQMLAYSGKAPFFVTPLELSPIVQETCDLLRASMPAHVRLTVSADEKLPLVETDPGQIQQVLVNLIVNAAEAVPENQPGAIVVRTFSQTLPAGPAIGPAPGTYVVLEVQDNGSGIEEKNKARIFDPFFTTKFSGRGLGLAAVQGIVRSSKGHISVDSAPGAGSTFRVYLPILHESAPAKRTEGLDPKTTAETGATILIIDDDEAVRTVARLALERAGYRVVPVDSGEAGLRILRQQQDPISLVLLDLGMPVMSGKEVLKQMRADGLSIPVAICSGYSEPDVRTDLAGYEVCAFIQKPFTIRDLPEQVHQLLRFFNAAALPRQH